MAERELPDNAFLEIERLTVEIDSADVDATLSGLPAALEQRGLASVTPNIDQSRDAGTIKIKINPNVVIVDSVPVLVTELFADLSGAPLRFMDTRTGTGVSEVPPTPMESLLEYVHDKPLSGDEIIPECTYEVTFPPSQSWLTELLNDDRGKKRPHELFNIKSVTSLDGPVQRERIYNKPPTGLPITPSGGLYDEDKLQALYPGSSDEARRLEHKRQVIDMLPDILTGEIEAAMKVGSLSSFGVIEPTEVEGIAAYNYFNLDGFRTLRLGRGLLVVGTDKEFVSAKKNDVVATVKENGGAEKSWDEGLEELDESSRKLVVDELQKFGDIAGVRTPVEFIGWVPLRVEFVDGMHTRPINPEGGSSVIIRGTMNQAKNIKEALQPDTE